MKYLVLLGRILYSAIFIFSGIGHFSKGAIHHAAATGVPMSSLLVPLSGLIAFVGGITILLGYKARYGAWLIIIFLVPVTLSMHKFWAMTTPTEVLMEHAMFMKNLSMIGAALLIAYFGSGPLSFDKPLKK